MLKVENLKVTYPGNPPVHAVTGISFELAKGKTTVLIGPSGSGKSATVSAILGQLPDGSSLEGSVLIEKQQDSYIPIDTLSEKERGGLIGWVPQDAQRTLSPTRSIGSLLTECLSFHRPEGTSHQSQIEDILKELDLPPSILKAFPHQLSGGQRQRCMLAIALIKNPRILVADEPTTALDALRENQWLDLIERLQETRDLTVLLITHDDRIASRTGDQFLYMKSGQLIDQPDPHSIGKIDQEGPASPVILDVSDLSVSFKSRGNMFRKGEPVNALTHVSFQLRKGEILGIAGESGSGKSTLSKCLVNLLPYKGNITLKEGDSSRVQLILQDSYSSLHPGFKIVTSLGESIRVWKPEFSSQERKQFASDLLKTVQLAPGYLDKYPGELSGGERQRVSIARALIPNPSILILDESISSLDYELQQDMIRLISSLSTSQELSMIMISHDVRILHQICHSILILHEGKVIESGPTDQLIQSPQHPQTKRLIMAAGFTVTESPDS